jgi:hypothetical protein
MPENMSTLWTLIKCKWKWSVYQVGSVYYKIMSLWCTVNKTLKYNGSFSRDHSWHTHWWSRMLSIQVLWKVLVCCCPSGSQLLKGYTVCMFRAKQFKQFLHCLALKKKAAWSCEILCHTQWHSVKCCATSSDTVSNVPHPVTVSNVVPHPVTVSSVVPHPVTQMCHTQWVSSVVPHPVTVKCATPSDSVKCCATHSVKCCATPSGKVSNVLPHPVTQCQMCCTQWHSVRCYATPSDSVKSKKTEILVLGAVCLIALECIIDDSRLCTHYIENLQISQNSPCQIMSDIVSLLW